MKIKRVTTSDNVRDFCIRHNLYTFGNNEQYENLLFNIVREYSNITDKRLYLIASDIYSHSRQHRLELIGVETVEDMIYLLLNDKVFMYDVE